MRKKKFDTVVRTMRAAAEPLLDPGEEVRACADVRIGSGLGAALAPRFVSRRFVVATGRRLLSVKATRWRGRPLALDFAENLGDLTLEGNRLVREKGNLQIRRANGDLLRCWITTRKWVPETAKIAELVEAAHRQPTA